MNGWAFCNVAITTFALVGAAFWLTGCTATTGGFTAGKASLEGEACTQESDHIGDGFERLITHTVTTAACLIPTYPCPIMMQPRFAPPESHGAEAVPYHTHDRSGQVVR